MMHNLVHIYVHIQCHLSTIPLETPRPTPAQPSEELYKKKITQGMNKLSTIHVIYCCLLTHPLSCTCSCKIDTFYETLFKCLEICGQNTRYDMKTLNKSTSIHYAC